MPIVSIGDGLSLWPWWLWTLTTLWIGALLFWQSTETATRERWGWGVLALVYAVLILVGGRMVPASSVEPSPTAWLLWCGLLILLVGAVTSIGLHRPRWQQFASGAIALGAGLALATLQAPEAALACGVVGVAVVRRSADGLLWHASEAVPRPNQWLAGLAAVATLVVMVGLLRHALLVEATRIGPSRWQTVFPTAAQIARREANTSVTAPTARSLPIEICGLAIMAVIAAFTRAGRPRHDSTAVQQVPS